MIEIPGKIPISIHPLFWVLAALIGWINSSSLIGIFIWIGIIFVSVLFHEFGHALTAVLFRQKAKIQLVALGGLTSFEGPKLSYWKQFLIVFNGPLFGFFLFVFATFCLHFDLSQRPLIYTIFRMTQIANLFWTVVNLFPILPLDGGQLLRIVLEKLFGVRGYRSSLLIGAILSGVIALGFFLIGGFLIGALFFLFAFQSFDMWRKSKIATMKDRDIDLEHLMQEGEIAIKEGREDEALQIFSTLRDKTSSGLFYLTATQYVAFILYQKGRFEESYQLLLPIVDHVAEDVQCLLHKLAVQHQNWELVAKLSTECFQFAPSQEMALNNAKAFAYLKQTKPAGGWLKTAWQQSPLDVEKLLKEDPFRAINQDPDFQHFISLMR